MPTQIAHGRNKMIPASKLDLAAICGLDTTEQAYGLMENGYRDMGIINTTLSEEGFSEYAEYLDNYEKFLAESE